MKGFKKCCISGAMDETDNDTLWYSRAEEGDISSECHEDEGIDW